MFGRKTGLFAAMATAVLLLGGCGTDGTVTEEQARGWYNEAVRNGYNGNNGVGVNGASVNGERNTYGMRTDGTGVNGNGTTLGNDIRNAWDDVTNGNGVNGTAADGTNGTVANGANNNGTNHTVR